MFILLTSPINFIALAAAKLMVNMIYFLNTSIRYIESLPFSTIKGIHITTFEIIIIYSIMLSIGYFFYRKKNIYLKLTFALAIILASVISINNFFSAKQKKLIVYNIRKSSAIDFIDGREHVLISDSALMQNPKDIAMYMQNNWCGLHLKEPENIYQNKLSDQKFSFNKNSFFISGRFIQFCNKRFAFADKNNFRNTSDNPVPVDYLIISDNIKVEIGELLDCYKPKMVIIDSSNSLWKSEKWIKECAELKVPCYSVLKLGALNVSI
jgi:competence protein ComEC